MAKAFESYNQFMNYMNEEIETELQMDTTILDNLVELVGSEEDVEECAKEAYEELQKAYEENELEYEGEDTPEKLAVAALLVKLVEKGKIDPEAADEFLETHLG